MNRLDVLRQAADAGYPPVRILGHRPISGAVAWKAFVQRAPTADVNKALRLLMQGPIASSNPWLTPAAAALPAALPQHEEPRVGMLSDRPTVSTFAAGSPIGDSWVPVTHLRAAKSAADKVEGKPPYERTGARLLLPDFEIQWNSPTLRAHQLGAIGVFPAGAVVIYLRTTVSAEQCHKTAIHEMVHAHLHAFVSPLRTHDAATEAYCEQMVSRLAWL